MFGKDKLYNSLLQKFHDQTINFPTEVTRFKSKYPVSFDVIGISDQYFIVRCERFDDFDNGAWGVLRLVDKSSTPVVVVA